MPQQASQPKTFLLRERNVAMAIMIFLSPFLVLTVLMAAMPQFAYIMPFFCMSQCQNRTKSNYYDYINRTMRYEIISNMTQNLILVLCLWILRKVKLNFGAINELKLVAAIIFSAYTL